MNQDEIKEILPSWILNSRKHYLIITDLNGNYLFVNGVFQERFSFISNNFIGLSVLNSIHPEDLEKCATASLECINNPDAVVNLKIRKPDGGNTGEYCETDWEFSLFADKKGKPVGILCLGHDTTELSKQSRIIIESENKIKRSEYLLNVIYNSSAEAHSLLDKDLKILYMNKVARSVLLEVFDREAKIGDDSLDFILPQFRDEFLGYYTRVLKGEVIRVEKLHEDKWWLFSLLPAYDDTANLIGISHNVLDITDRKSGEFRIANQNDKLKEIAWQQSHNVRQKVANILGLCNLFLEGIELSEEDKEKNIQFILHSAKELDRIIHEIVKNTEDSQYNI